MSRQFFDLCRDKHVRGRMMLRMMEALVHYAPNRLIAQTMAALPEPDQAALKRPEVRQWYLQTLREAQRHGPRGAQHDTAQLASSERAVREAPTPGRPQGSRPLILTAPALTKTRHSQFSSSSL